MAESIDNMPAGLRHIIYHCGRSRKDVYRALLGSLKVSLKVIYFLSFFACAAGPVCLECVREKGRERERGRKEGRERERGHN